MHAAAATATPFPVCASPTSETPLDLGIEWDAENRLMVVKQGGSTLASFTYDGAGRRATKTAGGVTTTYVYDGPQFLEERSSGGTIRYVYGQGIDDVLAKQDASGTFYYVKDHLGSVRQITNASGTAVLIRDYDPWGNLLAGPTEPAFAFTGREWDPETSLYYYRARYYDPMQGRFLGEDPARADSLANPYRYAENVPSALTDAFGLCAQNRKALCCLEELLDFTVWTVCLEHKPKPKSKWFATTRKNKIIIYVTCDQFWDGRERLLEEYYHVVRQWNTGRMTKKKWAWETLKHGYEFNKYEVEARNWAALNLPAFLECLSRE